MIIKNDIFAYTYNKYIFYCALNYLIEEKKMIIYIIYFYLINGDIYLLLHIIILLNKKINMYK